MESERQRRKRKRLARASAGRWGHLRVSAAFQRWLSFCEAQRHARWEAECKRDSVDEARELIVSMVTMQYQMGRIGWPLSRYRQRSCSLWLHTGWLVGWAG